MISVNVKKISANAKSAARPSCLG